MSEDAAALSPPRILPAPSATPSQPTNATLLLPSSMPSTDSSATCSSSSSSSRCIELPAPADDGWVYVPPPNLPASAVDAMGLATAGQLHLVEMGDTFRMMTRGQTFTSYVTVIERNGATRIDKRGIFMFFNKYEIDKDGKTGPASADSGALYWTSADAARHQLTFHRSIPLRDIRELLLGKDSQCFQSPVGHAAIDAHCFTIRCDSRQLDLECSDEVQVTSWILGLVNMMLAGSSRTLKAVDDSPMLLDQTRDSDARPAPASTAPHSASERRNTKRFSVMRAEPHAVSAEYRRASVAWMKAVNGDLDTPNTSRAARRYTAAARSTAATSEPGISTAQVEAKVAAPFRELKATFASLRQDVGALVEGLMEDTLSSLQRLSALSTAQTAAHSARVSALQVELGCEQRKRKALQNKVIDLQGNIRVYCRVRPTSERERAEGDDSVVECLSDCSLVIHAPTAGPTQPGGAATAAGAAKAFEFDRVFDASSTQEEVFRDVAPFVQSCVDGYNVCVFAYGQTGSGKSFTMEGPETDRGVNYRALHDLFALTRIEEHRTSPYSPYFAAASSSPAPASASPSSSSPVPPPPPSPPLPPPPNHFLYSISVSCLEIYNESVVDLLVKKREQRPLDIKQGQDGGVYVAELTEVTVSSVADVSHLLTSVAYPNRHTSATGMNEHSSRSHCALFVRVRGCNPWSEEKSFGKLVLIDLAGSERLNRSAVTGVGVKEAQCINQSLSALGNCINALQTKAAHVPYRNSKLTYLLSDCLGGNSKCLMFAQLSPCASSYGESVCSLGFASRARSVELGLAKRNVGGDEVRRLKAAAKEEKKERERWEKELAKAKLALKEGEDAARLQDDAVARLTRDVKERDRELAALRERDADKDRELERLRDAVKRKERKRVDWPDTRRLQSPVGREQENAPTVPAIVADIEARVRASTAGTMGSPLRESTAANKKRKDSPNRDDAGAAKRTAVDVALEPQSSPPGQPGVAVGSASASPSVSASASAAAAFPTFSAAATQSHSRIGAALREKYQRKAAPTTASSASSPNGPSSAANAERPKLFSASSRPLDVCVTPQSLCSATASTVRFTSVSVAEAGAARKAAEGGRAAAADGRRLRSAKPAPATPLTARYAHTEHGRRTDREWRA